MADWIYQIDGVDLNDRTNFVTADLPEVDNATPLDSILADLSGDAPVFIRSQPTSGPITINFHATQVIGGATYICSEAQWPARIAVVKALCGPGLHTISTNARGRSSAVSVLAAFRGMAVVWKTRAISLDFIAPEPEFQ